MTGIGSVTSDSRSWWILFFLGPLPKSKTAPFEGRFSVAQSLPFPARTRRDTNSRFILDLLQCCPIGHERQLRQDSRNPGAPWGHLPRHQSQAGSSSRQALVDLEASGSSAINPNQHAIFRRENFLQAIFTNEIFQFRRAQDVEPTKPRNSPDPGPN